MSALMSARAPGKVVLSGAYGVLAGAPALVTAVDRYAVASRAGPPTFRAEEVEVALAELKTEFLAGHPGATELPTALAHPHLDVAELRRGKGDESQKLGIGSSAAIVVAGLALILAEQRGSPAPLAEIRARALRAHRHAQGGGSGVDIDAATFGGYRFFQRPGSLSHLEGRALAPIDVDPEPRSYATSLPEGLTFEAWAVAKPASTREFVARVFGSQERDKSLFDRLLTGQCLASLEAERAVSQGSAEELLEALRAQGQILEKLGEFAGVPIFLPELLPLRETLAPGSAWLPAGAGGGDIMLYAGTSPSSELFQRQALGLGLEKLELNFGARGVHIS